MNRRTDAHGDGFLLQPRQKLVCLGDSITEAPDGYVSVMARMIAAVYPERSIRVVNRGVSGNRIVDMYARLDKDVISEDPDWVTVNVGVNDVWHGFFDFEANVEIPEGGGPNGIPLPLYEDTLERLVRKLQQSTRADIVLVTPTVIGEDRRTRANRMLDDYVAAMERVGSALGVRVCPMHHAFVDALHRGKAADPGYTLTTDGVHMNPVGNVLMAVTLLRSLGFFKGAPFRS
ncbi:MAG: SGNH/GDSL hydrolase family protein [Chthonomonadales bacterium]